MPRDMLLRRHLIVPYRSFTRQLLVSATVVWAGVRVGVAILGIGIATNLPVAAGVVLLTVVLVLMDLRRRSSHVFLENLGVSRMAVVVIVAMPPLLLEILWAISVRR